MEQALLAAILDAPEDDTHRLVYADWLDDQGQFDRAEFIRGQVAADRLAEGPERAALAARANELLVLHEKEWTRPVYRLAGQPAFRRGLIEGVRLPAERFLRRARALFERCPIRFV